MVFIVVRWICFNELNLHMLYQWGGDRGSKNLIAPFDAEFYAECFIFGNNGPQMLPSTTFWHIKIFLRKLQRAITRYPCVFRPMFSGQSCLELKDLSNELYLYFWSI